MFAMCANMRTVRERQGRMGVVVVLSEYWRAGPGPTRRRRRALAPAMPSNPVRELILPDPQAPGVVLETLDPHTECGQEGFDWVAWIDDPDGAFADRLELAALADRFRGIPGVQSVHTEAGGCFHVMSDLPGVALRRALAHSYADARR